jgi:hypothetical protein
MDNWTFLHNYLVIFIQNNYMSGAVLQEESDTVSALTWNQERKKRHQTMTKINYKYVKVQVSAVLILCKH